MLSQRRFVLSLLCFLAVAVAAPPPAGATTAANPRAFISTLVSQGVDLLKDQQMPEAQREQRFGALLEEGFDVPRIARFVLGRYWRSASPQDRTQFTHNFEQWVIATYSARFRGYSGETVTVTGAQAVDADTTIVHSQVARPNAPATQVDWRVRKNGNDYRITDVQVEGVSMALTQRDEFGSVIQRNGGTVAGLNKVLEERLARQQDTKAPPAH